MKHCHACKRPIRWWQVTVRATGLWDIGYVYHFHCRATR